MDVIAFGTVFLEVVFGEVPALPGPGEEIYTDQFAFSCGGGAVTVAVGTEVAEADPLAFCAVTTARMVFPTSAVATV